MNQIPQHLGIIMDGNRRWAKQKGLPVFKGHVRGVDVAKEIAEYCREKGVKVLTLFTFSTENWQRPKTEVDFLMSLCEKAFREVFKDLSSHGIRIKIIGEREKLPKKLLASLREIEKLTEKNKEMVLNIALSYGGRAEIAAAIRSIIEKKIPPEKITEKVISENLWTSDLDFLIRTGKEQRISNFLIWQAAYSELYFCQKYWPDFAKKDLDEALEEYSRRKRTKGK